MVGGKMIPRIRLTSAKDLVEVEAELGNNSLDISYLPTIYGQFYLNYYYPMWIITRVKAYQ